MLVVAVIEIVTENYWVLTVVGCHNYVITAQNGVSICKVQSPNFSSKPLVSEDTDKTFKVSSMVVGIMGCIV